MADPTVTQRSTPTGRKLDEGYQTLIAFASNASVQLWEKSVQPPGMDGGDPVETTTMHNSTYRTMAARKLITMSPVEVTAAYDPAVYDAIVALINVEGAITVHFSDGSSLSFYGFLQTFEPQAIEEGEQPEANITIQPTNTDPTDGSEAGPVYTAPSGSP